MTGTEFWKLGTILFNFEGPGCREADGELKERGRRRPSQVWGCSSAGRAPALHAGGQEFDPPHLHHNRKVEQGKERPTAESNMGS